MTLQKFLEEKSLKNAYVDFHGFSHLYVRKGPYLIEDKIVNNTIQLANMQTIEEGKGSFRALVDFLQSNDPSRIIIIECVLTNRMASICRHMRFNQINKESGLHFARSMEE
jgi:hypothetical protein